MPGVVGALRGEEVASLGVKEGPGLIIVTIGLLYYYYYEEGPGLLFSFPPPSPRSSFLLEGVVLCSFCKEGIN